MDLQGCSRGQAHPVPSHSPPQGSRLLHTSGPLPLPQVLTRGQRNKSQQPPDLGGSMAAFSRGLTSCAQELSSLCLECVIHSLWCASTCQPPFTSPAGDRLAPCAFPTGASTGSCPAFWKHLQSWSHCSPGRTWRNSVRFVDCGPSSRQQCVLTLLVGPASSTRPPQRRPWFSPVGGVYISAVHWTTHFSHQKDCSGISFHISVCLLPEGTLSYWFFFLELKVIIPFHLSSLLIDVFINSLFFFF